MVCLVTSNFISERTHTSNRMKSPLLDLIRHLVDVLSLELLVVGWNLPPSSEIYEHDSSLISHVYDFCCHTEGILLFIINKLFILL